MPGWDGDRGPGWSGGCLGDTYRGVTSCSFVCRPFPGVSVVLMLSPQRQRFALTP